MRLPARLLQRRPDTHKGSFGHIFILAGSARFSGAATLAAEAAMRAGAGLVTLGIPEDLNYAVIKIKPKEVMTLPLPQTNDIGLGSAGLPKIKEFVKRIDVIAIGPGLGRNKSTQSLIRKLITGIHQPMVIDADGLGALVGYLKILLGGTRSPGHQVTRILTPHPGEMARLLGISVKAVQARRKEIARKFAKDYQVTLALKGHNTIVADAAGNLYINKTGNPGMATAGSGDVLTGIIAAFLGQGLDGFSAAKYGAYLHGLSGDLAAKEKTQISLIASDIIAKIPEAIKKCS
ncbi:MAG: NAD(P)H-hydrate dehydratase [Candidatus Omnitrophica bacterium]|nr:NAD(P)H-hydrate dehydratase [Candidatus Omnitrophota bacterium]